MCASGGVEGLSFSMGWPGEAPAEGKMEYRPEENGEVVQILGKSVPGRGNSCPCPQGGCPQRAPGGGAGRALSAR